MRTRIFAGLALAGLLLLGLPTIATAAPEPTTGTGAVTIYVDNYPTQVVEGVPAPTRVFVQGTSPQVPVTGTVTVTVEGTAFGPFELVDRAADMVLTFPNPGNRPFEVSYSGDSINAPTTVSPGMLVARTSAAALTIAPGGRVGVGRVVTFNVTVTGAGDTPTGLVRFYVDNVQVHQAVLVNGSQRFSTQFNAIGAHQVSALYQGTGTYAQAQSATETLLIIEPSTVSLSASATSVAQGDVIHLVAQAPAGATGTVMFFRNGQSVGSASVGTDGAAAFPLRLDALGTSDLTAAYSGDNRYLPATSLPVTVQVIAAPTVPSGTGGGTTAPTPAIPTPTAALADTGSAGHPATGILMGLGLAAGGLVLTARGRLIRRMLAR